MFVHQFWFQGYRYTTIRCTHADVFCNEEMLSLLYNIIMTHVIASLWRLLQLTEAITGSNNSLSPALWQNIIWTNAELFWLYSCWSTTNTYNTHAQNHTYRPIKNTVYRKSYVSLIWNQMDGFLIETFAHNVFCRFIFTTKYHCCAFLGTLFHMFHKYTMMWNYFPTTIRNRCLQRHVN